MASDFTGGIGHAAGNRSWGTGETSDSYAEKVVRPEEPQVYKDWNGKEYPIVAYRKHMIPWVIPAGWVPFHGWCPRRSGESECNQCKNGKAHLCYDYQMEVDRLRKTNKN